MGLRALTGDSLSQHPYSVSALSPQQQQVNKVNNQLMQKLSAISDNALAFFSCLQEHRLQLALLAGLTLPFIFFMKKDEHQKAPVMQRCLIIFSLLCLLAGTLSPVSMFVLHYFYGRRLAFESNAVLWTGLLFFTALGTAGHYFLRRWLAPQLDRLKHRLIKKTSLERNVRTDVRDIKHLLPQPVSYDPSTYIDLQKGVFIGLSEKHQAQYIPLNEWQKQHADIIGTTGSGKGIACGILLYQSILAGEGVFVLDPKNDEWAPHVYQAACKAAGKPFFLIDLNQPHYQLDLLADMSAEQLEELFIAGFSLGKKGNSADFYRIDDRRAARAAARLFETGMTFRDLFNSDYIQGIAESIKGFFGEIEEISLLNAINARRGLNLKTIFDEGGCCYFIGSMRNTKIITAGRMIFVRLLQIAETRDRIHSTPKPIAIFLDELKYHISKPAMEGLGAARDKGVHIIMAHQSIADLRDCPADLNGDAVVGAVVENAKFKLVYKVLDPDTADWVSKMSGTILVDDETRRVDINQVLTEVVDNARTIRQAERRYIDTNMLLSLPEGAGYVFTNSALPRASLVSHVQVQKRDLQVHAVGNEDQAEMKRVLKAPPHEAAHHASPERIPASHAPGIDDTDDESLYGGR